MSWQVHIPSRGPEQPIVDAIADVSAVEDPVDRRVARELLCAAAEAGANTVGAVITEIEQADPAERRQLLDDAREAAGLARSEDIDDAERFRMTQRMAARRSSGRDADGAYMGCAAEGCNAMPMGSTGMPKPVVDRRWWCPEHRDQAGPDDHLPPTDVARIGLDFSEIPAPSVLRQQETLNERRRQEQERRQRDREAEAEVVAGARRRYEVETEDDDYLNPEIMPGIRVRPR